jgi:hypothetical protein
MPAILGLLLVTSLASVAAFHDGMSYRHAILLSNLVPLALLAVVIAQWSAHPRALRDAISGGYLEVEEGSDFVRWREWGIFFTRQGRIDEAAKRIHLSWSLFLGAIPIRHVDRSLLEFYRVAVSTGMSATPQHRRHHHHGFREIDLAFDVVDSMSGTSPTGGGNPISYTYSVALVDRHAHDLTLFSLSEFAYQKAAEDLVGRFRERLERAVGVPDRIGLGSPLLHAPRPDAEAKPHLGPHMMCPNCHKNYPLYLTTCPTCHVALFKDSG